MASVIITYVLPSQTGLLVGGTVDGFAHKMRISGMSDYVRILPLDLATRFGNDYYLFANAVAQRFVSKTIKITMPDGRIVSVVYGATPVDFSGFETILFTGTVGGVTAYYAMTKEEFLEWSYNSAGFDLAYRVAAAIAKNVAVENTYGGVFTATFTTPTTTTSTTSTTTATTTST